MDLGGLNPQQYLQGVNWPASKEEVVNKAESNGAPQEMIDQLKNHGSDQFSGPEDVVGKLKGGL